VEWLDPEVRDRIDVQNDRVSGTRTFRYVVRVQQPGQVDLGEITLPFFDADRKSYSVARASLGRVMVTPSTAPAQSAAPERDPFESVGPIRRSLRPGSASSVPISDRSAYWIVLAAAPLSVLMFSAGAIATRRIGSRLRTARGSWSRQISLAIGQAREALQAGQASQAAAATERAVHSAIEAGTGLRSRGVLRGELALTLQELGVDGALAERAVQLLSDCEKVRFEPDCDSGTLKNLIDQGEDLSAQLARKHARNAA
jgi:hypothetical protein